jgi:hypothetical protein
MRMNLESYHWSGTFQCPQPKPIQGTIYGWGQNHLKVKPFHIQHIEIRFGCVVV